MTLDSVGAYTPLFLTVFIFAFAITKIYYETNRRALSGRQTVLLHMGHGNVPLQSCPLFPKCIHHLLGAYTYRHKYRTVSPKNSSGELKETKFSDI